MDRASDFKPLDFSYDIDALFRQRQSTRQARPKPTAHHPDEGFRSGLTPCHSSRDDTSTDRDRRQLSPASASSTCTRPSLHAVQLRNEPACRYSATGLASCLVGQLPRAQPNRAETASEGPATLLLARTW